MSTRDITIWFYYAVNEGTNTYDLFPPQLQARPTQSIWYSRYDTSAIILPLLASSEVDVGNINHLLEHRLRPIQRWRRGWRWHNNQQKFYGSPIIVTQEKYCKGLATERNKYCTPQLISLAVPRPWWMLPIIHNIKANALLLFTFVSPPSSCCNIGIVWFWLRHKASLFFLQPQILL